MKRKNIILSGLVLIGLNSLSAQFNTDIKVGLLTSSTNSGVSKTLTLDPMISLSAGIDVSYRLDDLFSIGTGVAYNRAGFSTTQGTNVSVLGLDVPIGVKAKTEVNYLNIPLLLTARIPTTGKIEPYVAAGPNVAYALNGNIKTSATALFDFNVTNTALELGSSDYNRMQVWGNIRAGARIPYNENGDWLIEASYMHSFTDLVSEDFTLDLGGKHRNYNLSIGYGMRF